MDERFLPANGKRIRQLRVARGWTQKNLAQKIGCAKRTIENAEKSRRVRPRTILELAQVLKVEPTEIVLTDDTLRRSDPVDIAPIVVTHLALVPPPAPADRPVTQGPRLFRQVLRDHRLRTALFCAVIVLASIPSDGRKKPPSATLGDEAVLTPAKQLLVSSAVYDPARSDFDLPQEVRELLSETHKVQFEVAVKADRKASNVEFCISPPSDVVYLGTGDLGNADADIRFMRPRRTNRGNEECWTLDRMDQNRTFILRYNGLRKAPPELRQETSGEGLGIVPHNGFSIRSAAYHPLLDPNRSEGAPAVVRQAPYLTISAMHQGNFTRGQTKAAYIVTVANETSAGVTNAPVEVKDFLPVGLTLISMSGKGWECNKSTCVRTDRLNAGQAYPSIIVLVNVSNSAVSPLSNVVSVSGGSTAPSRNCVIAGCPDVAQDVTIIDPHSTASVKPPSSDIGETKQNASLYTAGAVGSRSLGEDRDGTDTPSSTPQTTEAVLIGNPADTNSAELANRMVEAANAIELVVSAQKPTITTLSPNSATGGGSAFALTVNGSGFVTGATVQWDGFALPTTFVSSTQLTASVSASLITTAADANVTVTNPGGAVSTGSFMVAPQTHWTTLADVAWEVDNDEYLVINSDGSWSLTDPAGHPPYGVFVNGYPQISGSNWEGFTRYNAFPVSGTVASWDVELIGGQAPRCPGVGSGSNPQSTVSAISSSSTSVTIHAGDYSACGGIAARGPAAFTLRISYLPFNVYVNPAFAVMGISYSPPGGNASSFVNYQTSGLVGDTTVISKSFQDAFEQSASGLPNLECANPAVANSCQLAVIGSDASDIVQRTTRSSGVAIDGTNSTGRMTIEASNSHDSDDHDYDIIWLWLDPAAHIALSTTGTFGLWNGYTYDANNRSDLDVISIYVGALNGNLLATGEQADISSRSWVSLRSQSAPEESLPIAGVDYTDILRADPFGYKSHESNPAYSPFQCYFPTMNLGTNSPVSADDRYTLSAISESPQSIPYQQAPLGSASDLTYDYVLVAEPSLFAMYQENLYGTFMFWPDPYLAIANPTPKNATLQSRPSFLSSSPGSATARGPAFTLTVNGSGFSSRSVLQWNRATFSRTYHGPNRSRVIGQSGLAVATASGPVASYLFPHIAFGGAWQITFTFVNGTTHSAACATSFYSDSGSAPPLLFDGSISGPLNSTDADSMVQYSGRPPAIFAAGDERLKVRLVDSGGARVAVTTSDTSDGSQRPLRVTIISDGGADLSVWSTIAGSDSARVPARGLPHRHRHHPLDSRVFVANAAVVLIGASRRRVRRRRL